MSAEEAKKQLGYSSGVCKIMNSYVFKNEKEIYFKSQKIFLHMYYVLKGEWVK